MSNLSLDRFNSIYDLATCVEGEFEALKDDKKIVNNHFIIFELLKTKFVDIYKIFRTNNVNEYNKDINNDIRKLSEKEYKAIKEELNYEI